MKKKDEKSKEEPKNDNKEDKAVNVEAQQDGSQDQEPVKNEELDKINAQLQEKTAKCEEYLGMLQRTAAEFDNYKKRTLREKEVIYFDAVSDAVTAFLPVADNLERAIQAASGDDGGKSLKEGVELVLKQVSEVLKNLGVEQIAGVGEKFDPQLHNAVMHVEDESCEENTIVEEFQKGYIIKNKVIRHSMVKVAN